MRDIGFCDFQTLIWNDSSCSNCLKYMEKFDYRSILVDSGSIVQCCVIIRVLAEKANKFCMTLECARDEEIRLCISEMTGETIF